MAPRGKDALKSFNAIKPARYKNTDGQPDVILLFVTSLSHVPDPWSLCIPTSLHRQWLRIPYSHSSELTICGRYADSRQCMGWDGPAATGEHAPLRSLRPPDGAHQPHYLASSPNRWRNPGISARKYSSQASGCQISTQTAAPTTITGSPAVTPRNSRKPSGISSRPRPIN